MRSQTNSLTLEIEKICSTLPFVMLILHNFRFCGGHCRRAISAKMRYSHQNLHKIIFCYA